MSQYAHLSEPDPEFVALQHILPGDRITVDKNPVQLKEAFLKNGQPVVDMLTKGRVSPDSTYTVQDHKVPVNGGEILVRVTSPAKEGTFPLLVWAHAGALKWAVSNADSLHASLDKGLLVGGQSAGAQMAAALALRARDDPFFKDHPLTGQILQIPTVVHPGAIPAKYEDQLLSMEQNKDAPILDARQHHAILTFLGVQATDTSFSPLLAASHAHLPPAVIQVCGLDPLRDEGFLYERILREAGTKTKLCV
ncbi:hypothetical protein EWM64_g5269 [Hericium alpestre]|uniref:Alpha/beta hydrolase fold-3 domain-containing protein n=1 Tax=Hericium alpestre TaxID=135208 RepID=A0A4Y9ZXF1_9AGAM|nr:hypothetical protein EWM64_g5269 [Hericium alpestre]